MGIGNHPELIIFHILYEKFEDVSNCNMILGLRTEIRVVVPWKKEIRRGRVFHRLLVEIFRNQVLREISSSEAFTFAQMTV